MLEGLIWIFFPVVIDSREDLAHLGQIIEFPLDEDISEQTTFLICIIYSAATFLRGSSIIFTV